MTATPGLQKHGLDAMLMQEIGLLAFARGQHGALALEVLQDDMSVNLPMALEQPAALDAARHCLLESLENINEFLLTQDGNTVTELVAVQIVGDQLIAYVSGDLCLLRFRQDQIKCLFDEQKAQTWLGVSAPLQAGLQNLELQQHDVLLLASHEVLKMIDPDFVRVTLGRFQGELNAALRQIDTRAQRNGLGRKPELLMCRIEQVLQKKSSGWFGRRR